MPGEAVDISSAGDEENTYVAIIARNGKTMYWDENRQAWQAFQSGVTQPDSAARIAIDAKGSPWVVSAEGKIWHLAEQQWIVLPGSAADIAIGPEGSVFISGTDRRLYQWDPKHKGWTGVANINQSALAAVGPNGKPWYVSTEGAILASDLFEDEEEKERRAAAPAESAVRRPGDPAIVTSTEPYEFVKVRGYASELAIGADGSVFVSGPDGQLLRWSPINKAFVEFPGALSRIAVDRAGNPWGLSGGTIYRFDGTLWTTVPGKAVDIAVGYEGTVMITDADETVYRYDPQLNRFARLPQSIKGSRIAVDPQGNPWTIRKDNSIFRCIPDSCTRTPRKGTSIAIGPDNSVFMTDADQHLYRWDTTGETWERINTFIPTTIVAVGPTGRPWVIDKNGAIYSSRFFERYELDDAEEILAASAKTSRSPVSTFTFTKSILFQKAPMPVGETALTISVGADGVVYAQSSPFPGELYRYNPKTSRFELSASQPSGVVNFWTTAESNGRLWHYNSGGLGCYRQTAPNTNNWQAPFIEGGIMQDICYHFSIGANNSVFAIIRTTADPPAARSLYRYDENKRVFVLFSDEYLFSKVAVDPNGNPWVITTDNRIWRHDGKKFLPLPGGGKPQKQDANWVAIGPTGAAYITDTGNNLFKWNETNKSFDRVNRTSVSSVAADAQGRPWTIESGVIFRPQ